MSCWKLPPQCICYADATSSAATGAVVIILTLAACAAPPVDPALEKYIAAIKAVDNHAHPMLLAHGGASRDTDYDALPLDALPPMTLPLRLRADHPDWIVAQRAVKERAIKSPADALDLAGIEVMLSNRIAMGPGLAPPRFLWVAFVDALMLPLDGRGGGVADARHCEVALCPRDRNRSAGISRIWLSPRSRRRSTTT